MADRQTTTTTPIRNPIKCIRSRWPRTVVPYHEVIAGTVNVPIYRNGVLSGSYKAFMRIQANISGPHVNVTISIRTTSNYLVNVSGGCLPKCRVGRPEVEPGRPAKISFTMGSGKNQRITVLIA
jgi:hypothetical protein